MELQRDYKYTVQSIAGDASSYLPNCILKATGVVYPQTTFFWQCDITKWPVLLLDALKIR